MKEFLQKVSIKLEQVFYFVHKCCFKKLGRNSVIYKPIMIRGRKYIELGDHCFFRNHARIEIIDHYAGEKFTPCLTIGNNTTFEQNLHLTCAEKIIIGENCVFSANVYISDLEHALGGLDSSILGNSITMKEVIIGNNCFIGMGSYLFAGTKLGNNVVVGANTIVKGEYPDDVMLVGGTNGHARIIKKFNREKAVWETI